MGYSIWKLYKGEDALVGGRVKGEGGCQYEGPIYTTYSMKGKGRCRRERGSIAKAHFIKLRYIAASIDHWRARVNNFIFPTQLTNGLSYRSS